MGEDGQRAHDDRYEVAEDYMEVVYKLWEGSWADDAVFADVKKRRVHATRPGASGAARWPALQARRPPPQRAVAAAHAGAVSGRHLARGRAFAARHAECVFMSGPSKKVIAPRVAAIRKLAAEAGRDPKEILMFAMMTVIVAPTDEEAQAKHADYRRYADPEGALTLMSGWTGVDFSTFDPDQVVEHVESDAGRTALENITRADPDRRWTVREVAEHVSIGGIGPVVVGSPATVADQLEAWIDETDLDGFNLAFVVRPETFVDVVDFLVPELQRRGRYKTAYTEGTLREKLFGNARLGASIPRLAIDGRDEEADLSLTPGAG